MEKNELKVFENEEFGKVRTVTVEGDVWFVGKDVAEALGYKDTDQAIRSHVDTEDKLTRDFDGSGQRRATIFINESGLYSLILSSQLPRAKEFKHWVTSEVLPSIRKTGAYIAANEQIKQMRAEAMLNNSQARISAEYRKLAEITQCDEHKEALIAIAANTIAGKDVIAFNPAEAMYTATEVGKMLGLTACKVGKIANRIGIKAVKGTHNEYGVWVSDVAKFVPCKQVLSWRFYRAGVDAIAEYVRKFL